MRKQLLLLVSILLPLISSCNVEPTEKPTVEPSEEIYYIDGLASNLFVTEVPENVFCRYQEDSDSYIAIAYGEKDGIIYKDIDCIIPNIYDDGIHGLRRIKSFRIHSRSEGYYNKLILSEGIEIFVENIGDIPAKEIFFPSTTKKINSIFYSNTGDPLNEEQIEVSRNRTLYYNGTISQFNQIEPIPPYGCVDDPFEREFICLDGVAYFEFFSWLSGC